MKCEACGKPATFSAPVHVVGGMTDDLNYRLICGVCITAPDAWVPSEWTAVIDNHGKVFWERCVECGELKRPEEMMIRQPYCRGCY